jgi:transcriptional regulator with XRE-family HTH domain
MHLHEAIAEALRLSAHKTQDALAEAMRADGGGHVSQGHVSRWINGKDGISTEMLDRLAAACGVTFTARGSGEWEVRRRTVRKNSAC